MPTSHYSLDPLLPTQLVIKLGCTGFQHVLREPPRIQGPTPLVDYWLALVRLL